MGVSETDFLLYTFFSVFEFWTMWLLLSELELNGSVLVNILLHVC